MCKNILFYIIQIINILKKIYLSECLNKIQCVKFAALLVNLFPEVSATEAHQVAKCKLEEHMRLCLTRPP